MGKEIDEVSEILGIIFSGLMMQMVHITNEYGVLPDKAKDNWALGYIGGYADGVLQRKGIGADETGSVILETAFITIFGKEQGPISFQKFMDLQQVSDPELFEGMKKGGEEVFTWLSNKDVFPMGWRDYVHGYS